MFQRPAQRVHVDEENDSTGLSALESRVEGVHLPGVSTCGTEGVASPPSSTCPTPDINRHGITNNVDDGNGCSGGGSTHTAKMA